MKKPGIHTTICLTLRRRRPSEARDKNAVQTHISYINLLITSPNHKRNNSGPNMTIQNHWLMRLQPTSKPRS